MKGAIAHEEEAQGDQLVALRPVFTRHRARDRAGVLTRWVASVDAAAGATAGAILGLTGGLEPASAVLFSLVFALGWSATAFTLGLYTNDDLRSWVSGVSEIPRGLVGAVLFSWLLFGALYVFDIHPAGPLTLYGVLLIVLLSAVGRAAVRARLHRSTPLRQRAVIVGSGTVAGQLVTKLRANQQFGIVPVGLVDERIHEAGSPELPLLGSFDDLEQVIDDFGIDRVIIAFSRAGHEDLLRCIRACRDRGVAVDVVPRLFEFLAGARALDQVGGMPVLSIGTPRLTRSSQIAKRALDLALSLLLLTLLAPLILAIALAIRLESPGRVFFRQPRVGLDGRTFLILKFRSMYADADQRKAEFEQLNEITDGVMFKIRTDPRVTRFGRLLRRFSLDELPQLLNVLKGDMSLVGPRPLIRPETDALYEDWHARRLDLRPGMTGPWQIQGRSETPFQEMVRLDYQYVSGWSLARDVEILLSTIPAVLSGRGAY